jgi:hypothetical protein
MGHKLKIHGIEVEVPDTPIFYEQEVASDVDLRHRVKVWFARVSLSEPGFAVPMNSPAFAAMAMAEWGRLSEEKQDEPSRVKGAVEHANWEIVYRILAKSR